MVEYKNGEPTPVSGLDMGPTIAWYSANQKVLLSHLPKEFHNAPAFPILGKRHIALTPGEINALINLFPRSARQRSTLNNGGSILGQPTLYFAHDATPEDIKTTTDVKDALSPTAIIPSYTDNARWQRTGDPSSDIQLFRIPESVNPAVAKIIHAQGFVHELAHTMVSRLLYMESHELLVSPSDGNIVFNGFDYLRKFAKLAERYPSISHYASFYRKEGQEFSSLVAIDEEFVETITARLLNFAFCKDEGRRFKPLSDRPEIGKMISDFLTAEKVKY